MRKGYTLHTADGGIVTVHERPGVTCVYLAVQASDGHAQQAVLLTREEWYALTDLRYALATPKDEAAP